MIAGEKSITAGEKSITAHAAASDFSSSGGYSRFRTVLVVLMIPLLLVIGGCQSQTRTLASDSLAGPLGPEGSGYLIGPQDVLHISVWGEENLDREALVRPDGGISFPLVGNMQAAGKTTSELQQDIEAEIQEFVPQAVVTVGIEEIAGYTIFVIGQVNQPGQFTLGRYVDVIQALTLAGGLTPFADENEIKVLRRQGGKEVVLPFNYSAVKAGEELSQNVTLQSGDTVVVP